MGEIINIKVRHREIVGKCTLRTITKAIHTQLRNATAASNIGYK
jgi:hypothetical protein